MFPDPDYGLFAKIVETGSLSAAARAVGLSPAMVSKRIARLEDRLGVRLLHRTTRKLTLTPSGALFHADVLEILAAVREAEARLKGGGEPAGPLRITAPTSFGRLHVAPHLRSFLDQNPRIRLSLDLSDEFSNLLSDKVDLAIRITSQGSPRFNAVRLANSRRILCAAPDYLRNHGLPGSIAQLKAHRLLAASGQAPWRLTGPEGELEIDVNSYVETNSSEVVRELAVIGLGVALRSLWDVSADLTAGRLVRVLEAYEGSAGVGIYAVYPRSPHVPANVALFCDFLKTLYLPLPPWDRTG